jgi:hypothetical protein
MPNLGKGSSDPSSVAADLKALAANSKILNQLTDDLTKQVAQIESIINALNLGISEWVVVDESFDPMSEWTDNTRLLYDKNEDGKWGLAIEKYEEHIQNPDLRRNYNAWAFRDAPRKLRLRAVAYIPALLGDLVKQSEELSKETAATLSLAKDIASNLYKPALDGPQK